MMQRSEEREWSLTIGPDTVRHFILKARAISAGLNQDYDGGSEHEIDSDGQGGETHHHGGLAEEEAEDLTRAELRALIEDLNVDEAAELIALAWIGRGDFTAEEWDDALAEARTRQASASIYLLGLPLLGEYLEDGLQALGA